MCSSFKLSQRAHPLQLTHHSPWYLHYSVLTVDKYNDSSCIKMKTWLKTSYVHDPKAWASRLLLSNICWENQLYLAVDLFWHLRPNFPRFSFPSSSLAPVFPVSPLSHLAVIADAHPYAFLLPGAVRVAIRAWLDKPNEAFMCRKHLPLLATVNSLPDTAAWSFERGPVSVNDCKTTCLLLFLM